METNIHPFVTFLYKGIMEINPYSAGIDFRRQKSVVCRRQIMTSNSNPLLKE